MAAISHGASRRRGPGRLRSPRSGASLDRIGRPGILWTLPAIVVFALFVLLPLGVVVWLSFTSWSGIGSPQWVGGANWSTLFNDPVMRKSILLMLLITGLQVVTQTPVSLLIGVWAAGRQRNRAVLTALYFIPLLMSSAAISIVWRALLDPNFGLPSNLRFIFGSGNLFGETTSAIGVIVFVNVWQWTPLHSLIYQGGARAIPDVLYQAATIDGAGRVRQFFTITLPQLRNTMVTSLILMVVGSMTTFDAILILTQGGPGTSTTTTAYYMYDKGFLAFQFGAASVIGLLLAVVATAISLVLVKTTGYDRMTSAQEGI